MQTNSAHCVMRISHAREDITCYDSFGVGIASNLQSASSKNPAVTVRRLCPSMTELQAFEAACRHQSFTQTALELHCTQGAVSRQIASLEATVGVPLFERTRQRLVLTDAGKTYLQAIQPALAQLEAATLQLLSHRGKGGTLNIASFPTFGAKWLIPRLPHFTLAHPEVTLNFLPHALGYDFSRAELDASIRFGEGVWPGTVCDYVAGREVVAVIAPPIIAKLRKSIGRRNIEPNDLINIGLLHHNSVPSGWSEWFSALGINEPKALIGPRFDQFTLVIQAVTAGIGAGLVPRCLIDDELRAKRVVTPFQKKVSLSQGYYLCAPESKAQLPSLQTFRNWLLSEAALNG
jgi:LysR family transcriptional regulator, glycine cleavage system transcriptional activator